MPFCEQANIQNEMVYIFNFFRNDFQKRYKCVLPIPLLRHTVISYLEDLDRLSLYHNLVPDNHKQSAHIVYWFCKIKPIHILDNNYNRPSAPFINEIFSFYLMKGRLNIDFHIEKDKAFFLNFLYMLHFRDIRPEPLYMTMYLIDRLANSKTF